MHEWSRSLTAWLLSLAVVLLTCNPSLPVTPRGVQCPTAAVQTVVETKFVRNCCGKLVAVESERAPREGEAAFKQCRCAEKKAAEKQEQAKSSEERETTVLFLCSSGPIHIRGPIFDSGQATFIRRGRTFEDISFSPPTPPPKFI